MRIVVVTDHTGQVVAATHASPPPPQGPRIEILPKVGQRLHEVDIPQHLAHLSRDKQLHAALEHFVPEGASQLQRRDSK